MAATSCVTVRFSGRCVTLEGAFKRSAHHLNVPTACLAARPMKVVASMRRLGFPSASRSASGSCGARARRCGRWRASSAPGRSAVRRYGRPPPVGDLDADVIAAYGWHLAMRGGVVGGRRPRRRLGARVSGDGRVLAQIWAAKKSMPCGRPRNEPAATLTETDYPQPPARPRSASPPNAHPTRRGRPPSMLHCACDRATNPANFH